MQFLKKLWQAATKSPLEKKLTHLEDHFWYIRNNCPSWLAGVSKDDTRADEAVTPIELTITSEEWDALADQYGHSASYKFAHEVRKGDDVIQIYPFIGETAGWKNAVELFDQIGLTLSLKFDEINETGSIIDLHAASKVEGRPLWRAQTALKDILKSRDFD